MIFIVQSFKQIQNRFSQPLLKGHYVMRKRDAYPAELPPDTLKYGVIGQ